MNIMFLGAPGAGKGTQSAKVAERLQIPTVSTGDILRAAIKAETPIGLKAKSFIDAGQLVPDQVVIDLVKARLAEEDCKAGFILDGFPRTVAQAQALKELGVTIHRVLNLSVEDEVIVGRMSGRRVCSGCGATYHIKNNKPRTEGVCDRCGGELIIRKDDNPETVTKRLEVYYRSTAPLVDFYKAEGNLVTVEDTGVLEETSKLVFEALGLK